jgi:acid phosphatase family membrane protein YuiD
VRRTLTLAGLATLALNLASFSTGTMPPRDDSSRSALTSLGQEYGDLQQWATAIAATTDTLPTANAERARVLADQLARLIRPLEEDFARTTASLSTAQIETILPLWERMAFAHAGFVLLQEQAAALGGDPALQPAELHQLAAELSAVLDFAAEIQRMALTELTAPPPTPIRII